MNGEVDRPAEDMMGCGVFPIMNQNLEAEYLSCLESSHDHGHGPWAPLHVLEDSGEALVPAVAPCDASPGLPKEADFLAGGRRARLDRRSKLVLATCGRGGAGAREGGKARGQRTWPCRGRIKRPSTGRCRVP